MPKTPAVQFVVTLALTEEGEALAGEVGVIVGTERMWGEHLDRDDLEVPGEMALRNALKRGREWLDIWSASSTPEPPPSAPKRRRTTGQKDTSSRGVSRSRLR